MVGPERLVSRISSDFGRADRRRELFHRPRLVAALVLVVAGLMVVDLVSGESDPERRVAAPATVPGTPRPPGVVAVTEDGRLVVLTGEDGQVVRVLAEDAVAQGKDADGSWSLSVTPDGAAVYFMRQPDGCLDCVASIASVPVAGGPVTNPLEPGCCIRSPAVSPDGHWLAFTGVPNKSDAGRQVLLVELTQPPGARAGRQWSSAAPLRAGISGLSWAPNSTELAYVLADAPDGTYPRVLDTTVPESTSLDHQPKVAISDAMSWAGYLGDTGEFLVVSDAGDTPGESLSANGKPLRVAAFDAHRQEITRVLFELHAAEHPVADPSGAHILVKSADTLYRWSDGDLHPTKLADGIRAAIWLPGSEASTTTTLSPAGVDTKPEGAISGQLFDGRRWMLRSDPDHGLCLTVGTEDFGCDDAGPVISAGEDPATPRTAIEPGPFDNPHAGFLVYAYLPPGTTSVVLIYADGRALSDGLVIEPTARFWATPVAPGDNPSAISYLGPNGTEVARFP